MYTSTPTRRSNRTRLMLSSVFKSRLPPFFLPFFLLFPSKARSLLDRNYAAMIQRQIRFRLQALFDHGADSLRWQRSPTSCPTQAHLVTYYTTPGFGNQGGQALASRLSVNRRRYLGCCTARALCRRLLMFGLNAMPDGRKRGSAHRVSEEAIMKRFSSITCLMIPIHVDNRGMSKSHTGRESNLSW
jgi:hypothetical protein